jgi:hypothetical protein
MTVTVNEDAAASPQRWLAARSEQGARRLRSQVLHKFYVNAFRKLGVPGRKALSTVELFRIW